MIKPVNRPPERSAFAGFSRRLAAGLIDWLLVLAALWLTAVLRAALGESGGGWSAVLTVTSVVLLPLLYFSLLWTRNGQTYGMRAAEIGMISTDTWEAPYPAPCPPSSLRRGPDVRGLLVAADARVQ
jgi:uncharacterized RDD family membrane protein YckC